MKPHKSRTSSMNILRRHYMGEDLDSLSLKELQNVEQQLDTALKHIRSKKVCPNTLNETLNYNLLFVSYNNIF